MHNHRIVSALTGLLLLALAGTAAAWEPAREAHPPHQQNRGTSEWPRGHDGRHERGGNEDGHRQGDRHDWVRHDNENAWHHDRDRDPHWSHEHWRADNGTHSWQGRGYWRDYDYGYHGEYRHRYYNHYHYYYNTAGFYFPGYGFIERGHVHSRYCPHWHFEDFATGFVLGAIIND